MPEMCAKLISVGKNWVTLKMPGKRPFKLPINRMTDVRPADSPEEIELEMIRTLLSNETRNIGK